MSSFSSNSNQLSSVLNNFSEGKVEPIYFLMGDDQYLQQFFIKKFQESIDQGNKIDKMMLSVEEIGSKDVINKLNESDIFSSNQLFILRNPNALRGKTRDELSLIHISEPTRPY